MLLLNIIKLRKGCVDMVQKTEICGYEVSRLIIGGNTISGTSHVDKAMDNEMEDYFTTKAIKDMLFNCMKHGINTMQLRGDKHILRIIREFRLEGGDMQWIAQSAPEFNSFNSCVNSMSALNPIMMYHHGVDLDNLFKMGKYQEIKDRLAYIRSKGLPVGLGTHMPEVIEYSQMHNWDVDFYMACVYNISTVDKQMKAATAGNEDPLYDDKDVPIMYEAIRSVKQPCLAFKILSGNRKCETQETVKAAFNQAFENIKPSDAVVVGMFPKYIDQVALNAQYTFDAIEALNK